MLKISLVSLSMLVYKIHGLTLLDRASINFYSYYRFILFYIVFEHLLIEYLKYWYNYWGIDRLIHNRPVRWTLISNCKSVNNVNISM